MRSKSTGQIYMTTRKYSEIIYLLQPLEVRSGLHMSLIKMDLEGQMKFPRSQY